MNEWNFNLLTSFRRLTFKLNRRLFQKEKIGIFTCDVFSGINEHPCVIALLDCERLFLFWYELSYFAGY